MAFNPINPSEYIGKQLILDSNRILLNSREDNLFFSDKGFSFSTNGEFHFNTENKDGNKFVVNAPKIQLGINEGQTTIENPAVKGIELEEVLTEVLDIIDTFYKVDSLLFQPIAPGTSEPTACIPDAEFSEKTIATQTKIQNLKDRLKDFQSKKVFVT